MKFIFLPLIFIVLFWSNSYSSTARVIKLKGVVDIYESPSNKSLGRKGEVLFNGKYYLSISPKLGLKLKNGSIIKTKQDSQVRLIFNNGDQFNVAQNTFYEVKWDDEKYSKGEKKSNTIVNLMYGKVRAIVSKDGPRSNLKVSTTHAAMGVRGTDFYVSNSGQLGKMDVSVIRGEVDVTPKVKKMKGLSAQKKVKPQIIKVKPGFSAFVSTALPKAEIKSKDVAIADVQVRRTSKVELAKIQKDSVIEVTKEEEEKQLKEVSKNVATELQKLEKTAVKTTLEDIKRYDENLYNAMVSQKVVKVEDVNTASVKKVFKKAPERPLKPGEDDFAGDYEDVYQKYLKVLE